MRKWFFERPSRKSRLCLNAAAYLILIANVNADLKKTKKSLKRCSKLGISMMFTVLVSGWKYLNREVNIVFTSRVANRGRGIRVSVWV
jgi:hypothetical protein